MAENDNLVVILALRGISPPSTNHISTFRSCASMHGRQTAAPLCRCKCAAVI